MYRCIFFSEFIWTYAYSSVIIVVMLKRTISKKLHEWKTETDHKCLLLRGARQVGKTYSVRDFGQHEYDSFVYVNFLEKPGMKAIFNGNLDTDTLMTVFSVYMPEANFIPGKTLLCLDEIQECPEAVTSLKFWAQDKRYDVIATGSMLGIDYNRATSYPVGSISYLDMYPLGFMEFLTANNISDQVISLLKDCFSTNTPVPPPIHDRLMELLRFYTVVGGMPEVVELFVSQHDIAVTDKKQRAILEDYRYDIAHYTSAEIKSKAEKCYFSLPDQLAKDNHKFKYSVVEKGSSSRKFGSSVDWLNDAGLINRVCNLRKIEPPLRSQRIEENFRMYPSDIGLLVAMYDSSIKRLILYPDKTNNRWNAKGGIYEALIADILTKNGHKELYYRKNEQATFEIEFLLESEDGIIPIEVKAGNSRSKSLDNLLKTGDVPYGYKLIDGNIGRVDKKISLPLYMAMFI